MTSLSRTWSLLLFLTLLGGCSLGGDVDLLEARLRNQEDRQFELEAALKKSRSELEIVQRQNDMLHNRLPGNNSGNILPEQADVLFRAKGIRIQKWMTGGLDRDDQPGDELLTLVIAPHDDDGETVKLPGTIQLRLLDPAMPEDGQRIGEWTFTSEESRRHWHKGMIASGYQFRLPWQQVPHSSKLMLHATLTTSDGRKLHAGEFIHVEPPESKVATTPDNSPGMFPTDEVVPISETFSSEGKTADPKPVSENAMPSGPAFNSSSEQNTNETSEELESIDSSPRLRTSDNWTDATIPRLR
jgi:hypothetical protein